MQQYIDSGEMQEAGEAGSSGPRSGHQQAPQAVQQAGVQTEFESSGAKQFEMCAINTCV